MNDMDEVERQMRELGFTEKKPFASIDLEASIMLHMIRGLSREAAMQEVQLEETFEAAHENLLERRLPSVDDRSEDIEQEY